MAQREQRDDDERHVDEERDAPADRIDEDAADDRAEDHEGGGRRGPDPERAAALLALERFVMIASEPGTSSAPAAPWNRRATTSHSSVGASPHRTDVTPNQASPIAKTRRRP